MQSKSFNVTHSDMKYGLSGLVTAPIGYLVLLFLPVYLEVVGISLSLSGEQIGWLASTDSIGLALATLIFSIFIKKVNFRKVLISGVIITVLGNLVSAFVQDFILLCIIRTLTGLGEGMIVAVGISALGMTQNPNRWFGFYTATMVVVQAIGLLLLPIIYESFSLLGVFISLALLYLLPLAAIKLLPRRSEDFKTVEDVATPKFEQPKKLLNLGLISLLFCYMGVSGAWAYMSFMGTSAGLSLSYVSQALAISMIAGLLGAMFFALIGDTSKRVGLMLISLILMALSLWGLDSNVTELRYLVALSIFAFFWSIASARLSAVISDVDRSGKYISAAQTVLGFAYILGPILAATLIQETGYTRIIMMATVLFSLCFVFLLPLARFKTS